MVRSLKSPSFWVALLALVVAMGGSAFAATLINGANIRKGTVASDRLKRNTVKGDRVASNTLTGADIAESKLGTVGKAFQSTVAGAAADAGLLGGDPPSRFVRFGRSMSAGYTVTGAYGCTTTAGTCVVSLPEPSNANITGFQTGCAGSANAPTAPPGVVCLYSLAGTATGAPLGAGSRYGFAVSTASALATGVYAYTAPSG
jgi:hypothetical protein